MYYVITMTYISIMTVTTTVVIVPLTKFQGDTHFTTYE